MRTATQDETVQHVPQKEDIQFYYRNHKGAYRLRNVYPNRLYWGVTQWHTTPQWLLEAFDNDKGLFRTFALKDCDFLYASDGDCGK